jgi:signal peptidase I
MEILDFFKEILQTVILALLVVLPIRLFIFQPFIVKGQSMEPNFEDGDYLIIDEITYRFREPKRGEVVVFKNPMNERQRFIKRIVGLPGETIEVVDGKIFILNGEKKVLDESSYLNFSFTSGNFHITLGKDEFFVLGDNRQFSLDSRRFGPIKREEIVGRVLLRLWPIYSFAKFEAPAY